MTLPQEGKQYSPRMVLLITRDKDQKKLEGLFDDED